jgi:environmental stress-induced protein Ves
MHARLIDGPTSDFNVMTRRGQWRAELAVLEAPAQVGAADALLLLCGAGRWRVAAAGAEDALAPRQALLWRAPAGPLSVRPGDITGPHWLLAVRLCQHRPR